MERSAPIHRDAVSVAICGRPNVGKSSLMNRLLGHTRAIVSHVSGTTRDLIDDVVTVTEEEIEGAIVALLSSDQVVAEAAGALGVAAVRAGRVRAADDRPAVAVITGANIDARVLTRLLAARA